MLLFPLPPMLVGLSCVFLVVLTYNTDIFDTLVITQMRAWTQAASKVHVKGKGKRKVRLSESTRIVTARFNSVGAF